MKKKKTLLLVFKDIKTGNVEAPGLKLFKMFMVFKIGRYITCQTKACMCLSNIMTL